MFTSATKRHPTSRKIMGTPLWLLVLPMVTVGLIKNRGRTPLDQHGNRNQTEDAWVTNELCLACGHYTDHQYIQWADEPVVTVECVSCGHSGEYSDAQ